MNERNQKIVHLWEKNFSSNQIANELGITRGAVMGIIFRLREKGVTLRHKTPKELNFAPSQELPMVKQAPKSKPTQNQLKFVFEGVEEPPIQNETETSTYVKLIDLEHWHCRYVIDQPNGNGALFCGKVKTYRWCCKQHHKLCYLPNTVKPKKKQEEEVI
jgi:hypothetical protein